MQASVNKVNKIHQNRIEKRENNLISRATNIDDFLCAVVVIDVDVVDVVVDVIIFVFKCLAPKVDTLLLTHKVLVIQQRNGMTIQ